MVPAACCLPGARDVADRRLGYCADQTAPRTNPLAGQQGTARPLTAILYRMWMTLAARVSLAAALVAATVHAFRVLAAPWRRRRWRRWIRETCARSMTGAEQAVAERIASWPRRRTRALASSQVDARDVRELLAVRGIGLGTVDRLRASGIHHLADAARRAEQVHGVGPVLMARMLGYRDDEIERAHDSIARGAIAWMDALVEAEFDEEWEALHRREADLANDRDVIGRVEEEAARMGAEEVSESFRRAMAATLTDLRDLLLDPARLARLPSILLVTGFAFFVGVAQLVLFFPEHGHALVEQAGAIAILAATAVAFYHFVFADLRLTAGLRPPNPRSLAEQRLQVQAFVLASRAGVLPPLVRLKPDREYNAFAVGSRLSGGLVVLHTGLVEDLPEPSVLAVIGHEVTHLRNQDCRARATQGFASSLMNGIAAVMAFAAVASLGVAAAVGRGGRRRKADAITVSIVLLALAVTTSAGIAWMAARLATWSGTLVNFAIGRRDEFRADAGAAELVGSTGPVLDMLRSLEESPAATSVPLRLRHSLIADPARRLAGPVGLIEGMFSSHPAISKRITALERGTVGRALSTAGAWVRAALGVVVAFVVVIGTWRIAGHLADHSAGAARPAQAAMEPTSGGRVTLTRACDLWSYDSAGRPLVVDRAAAGTTFRRLGQDDRSIAIALPNAQKAWIVHRCVW